MQYQVAQYRNGVFHAILSGMGRNRGTLDSRHGRSAAYRHARELRAEQWRSRAGLTYKVVKTNIGD